MVNPLEPFKFPKNSSPVDAIAGRLQGWQTLATLLAEYATQLADFDRTSAGSNERLAQLLEHSGVKLSEDAVLTYIPSALAKLHSELQNANRVATNDLSKTISRLRQTAIDAQQRAENIRTYSRHFNGSTHVYEVQARVKTELATYQDALKNPKSEVDPYLLKSRVDRIIAEQVNLENKLLENYHTVQTLAAQYDEKITTSLRKSIREIEAIFAASGAIQVEFCKGLKENVYDSTSPEEEFDTFLMDNKNSFITEDVPARNLSDVSYEGQYATASKFVRKGDLERRSKILKSFSGAEYILTLTALYEIKDGNRSLGIDLTDAEFLADHKHTTDDRFALKAKQLGTASGKYHTWVFRSENARQWAADLKKICSVPLSQRAIAVFGSETFDPSAESNAIPTTTASSTAAPTGAVQETPVSNETAELPKSVPAEGTPLDAASTAAITSGNNSPQLKTPAVAVATPAPAETLNVDAPVVAASQDKGLAAGATTLAAAPAVAVVASDNSAGDVSPRTDVQNELTTSENVEQFDAGPGPLSAASATGAATEGNVTTSEAIEQRSASSEYLPSGTAGVAGAAGVAGVGTVEVSAVKVEEEYYDSASSVSDVEPPSPDQEESKEAPPAHSAAWQAQRDLAAFDDKVSERDNADESAIVAGDADSQFSYDKKHRASTYTGEDYKPPGADLPPHVERKLTQTYHKFESPLEGTGAARTETEANESSEQHFERRRSSVSLNRTPSRRATASYGGDELKPLTNPDQEKQGKAELFFASELPETTTGNPSSN